MVLGQETKVCMLDKSLYSFKQVPKKWHDFFYKLLISNEFKVNKSNKCI